MTTTKRAPMTVYVLKYSHKHGDDISLYADEESAMRARQAIAQEWWESEMPEGTKKPSDPEEMADAYFEHTSSEGREFCDIEAKDVIGTEL